MMEDKVYVIWSEFETLPKIYECPDEFVETFTRCNGKAVNGDNLTDEDTIMYDRFCTQVFQGVHNPVNMSQVLSGRFVSVGWCP